MSRTVGVGSIIGKESVEGFPIPLKPGVIKQITVSVSERFKGRICLTIKGITVLNIFIDNPPTGFYRQNTYDLSLDVKEPCELLCSYYAHEGVYENINITYFQQLCKMQQAI